MDYYDTIIQERAAEEAARILADDCRKKDAAIEALREKLKVVEEALEGAETTMATLQQILKHSYPGLWDSVDYEWVTRIKKALAAIRGEKEATGAVVHLQTEGE